MMIAYTRHAQETITLRRLMKARVELCVRNPDEILPGKLGKKQYINDFGKNYLKTIVAEESERLVVLTAYWFAKKRRLR